MVDSSGSGRHTRRVIRRYRSRRIRDDRCPVGTTLPTAVRANANCHEMEGDKELNGLGGSLQALTIVELPLEIGEYTLYYNNFG